MVTETTVTSPAAPAIPAPAPTVESLGAEIAKTFERVEAAQGLPEGEQGGATERPRDPETGRFLPKAETTTPTEPAPAAPTPTRIEETAEWKKAQSSYDKQIAQIRAELAHERAERARDSQARRFEAEIARGEAQYEQDLIEREGLTPEVAKKIAQKQTELYRKEQELLGRDSQTLSVLKRQAATVAANKYGLTDASLLYAYNSPEEMDRAASQLAIGVKESQRVKALEAEIKALKEARVPNGTDASQQFAGGVTSAGMGMSDDDVLRRSAEGDPNISLATVEAILTKRGMHPLR